MMTKQNAKRLLNAVITAREDQREMRENILVNLSTHLPAGARRSVRMCLNDGRMDRVEAFVLTGLKNGKVSHPAPVDKPGKFTGFGGEHLLFSIATRWPEQTNSVHHHD